MKEMYDKIKNMVETDIQELISKGSLDPCDYKPLGDAIDIVKDIHKIKMMSEGEDDEDMMRGCSQTGSYVPMDMDVSHYNPMRSPRTGRYVSRDDDGSMKRELEELLERCKDDHDRMLIMRLMSKVDK